MATTIHFYNFFVTHNGQKTNISSSDLLDNIIAINEVERYKNTQYGSFSLLDMIPPNPNSPTYNDRIVAFGNYRDRKPFLGNRGTDRYEEIDDDVLELTTCVFIPTYYMAIIEYNHFGCRPKHIETYLNSFLPRNENDEWKVELIPIQTQRSIDDIRQSHDIRNVEIKLDLLSNARHQLAYRGENQSLVENILNPTIEAYNQLGANVATFQFGQGRFRRNPMDIRRLIDFLTALDIESEVFASIKVKYRSPTTGKIEDADLKNEGILKRIILENENDNGFEFLGTEISNYFYRTNRLGSNAWRQYHGEIIADELPILNNVGMVEE